MNEADLLKEIKAELSAINKSLEDLDRIASSMEKVAEVLVVLYRLPSGRVV